MESKAEKMKTLIKIRNIFNNLKVWLVLTIFFTAVKSSAQMVVTDPWQQMLTDHQTRVLSQWHTYQAELMGKMWKEANKTNQYLDYLRDYEHEKKLIKGDPKKIKCSHIQNRNYQ